MGNTQLFVQAKTGDPTVNYTAQQVRRLFDAMYPIEGVLGNGHLKVAQRAAGANMSVDVAPGGCVVECDWVANGGTYLEFEDTVVNVTIPAAPSSGSRTHMIVEQARDPQIDGQSLYSGAPLCIPDTGSGAVLPKSAYLLATVTVNHGDASVLNAAITDMRTQASGPPPDAVVPVSYNASPAGRIQVPHGLDSRPRFADLTLDSQNNTYKEYLVSIASDVVTWELRSTATGSLAAAGQTITGTMYVRR